MSATNEDMIKKISVSDLRPGMRVAELKSELWGAHPRLYSTPGVLASEEQIRSIAEAGFTFAYIENAAAEPAPRSSLTVRGEVELTAEVSQARAVYAEATEVAHQFFTRAALGKRLDVEPPARVIRDISDSVCRNPDAMHCLARLTPLEGRLATHSVNVAVLCVVFGSHLGLPREDVLELGLAGMLHDIGKARVSTRILEKRGPLTAEEYTLVKAHSMHAISLLNGREGASGRLRQAVAEHHERFDGGGYPFGLAGKAITPFGRYIALADCFDALTSKRPYKQAILPSRALSIMYQLRGSQFAPEDVDQFVKCVGVYPTGSLVRLSDGRTAVVYEANPDLPLSPIVNVVLDDRLKPVTPRVVNLAEEGADHGADNGADKGEHGRVEVVSALCPEKMGMDMSRLLARVTH